MFFHKLFLVVFAVCIFATSAFTQSTDSVGRVWVKTVSINQFPNPDLIQPGDTVMVEISGKREFFIANPDSLNSQWAITVAALRKLSTDKNATVNVTVGKRQPIVLLEDGFDWYKLLAVILAIIILLGWLYTRNPTEWRPMIPGGVSESAVDGFFERQARNMGGALIPGTKRKIRLFGLWATKHRGFWFLIPHFYFGGRAWRAKFRVDGQEIEKTMLQGCGNDVAAGAAYISLGGTFQEGWGDEVTVLPLTVEQAPSETTNSAKHALDEIVQPPLSEQLPPASSEQAPLLPTIDKGEMIRLSELTVVGGKVVMKGEIPLNDKTIEQLGKLLKIMK